LLESWRTEAANGGECKTMFEILDAIKRCADNSRVLAKIADVLSARLLALGTIIADDETHDSGKPKAKRGKRKELRS
jgi:hypothetical protein